MVRVSATYNETIQRIYDLQTYGIKLGLSNIRRLLSRLGNPHEKFSAILVAGTNGKGIVASCMASILQESGHRVGLFTSPHLIRFTERIRINGQEIAQKELLKNSERIWRELESLQSSNDHGSQLPITFFEFSTALACQYFAEAGCDVAVIEVGMGGRMDATNVIEPVLSVITGIEYDHERYLGKSLEEIAREKAGIFREGVPAIALNNAPEILESLRRVAGRVGTPLTIVENIAKIRPDRRTFDVSWYGTGLWGLRSPLPGLHQIANSTLASIAALELRDSGFRISSEAIRRGLWKVRWPGRFERIGKKPHVILDGAHNPAAICALTNTLRWEKLPKPIIPVVALMSDKDCTGVLNNLSKCADTLVATCLPMDRSLDAGDLATHAKDYFPKIHAAPNPVHALAHARKLAGREGTVIVTGSLFLVGHIREAVLGPNAQ